jgi:hypothetical protein
MLIIQIQKKDEIIVLECKLLSESIFFRYTEALAREVNTFYSYLGKLISWQDLAQSTGKK